MKLLQTLALVGILGFSGCKIPEDSYGTYEGYPFMIHNYLGGKTLNIYLDQKSAQCNCDNISYIMFNDKNNDDRFDEISLRNISKGNPIEKFANFETAHKILAPLTDKKEENNR